jgi:hypothetical protein
MIPVSKITIYQKFVIQFKIGGIEQFRAYKSELLGGFCAKFVLHVINSFIFKVDLN